MPAPWTDNPFKLWSYMELLEFGADSFMGAVRILDIISCVLSQKAVSGHAAAMVRDTEDEGRKNFLLDRLIEFEKYAEALDATVSVKEAQALGNNFYKLTVGDAAGLLSHLSATFNRELGPRRILFISQGREAYFGQTVESFVGETWTSEMFVVKDDLEEALNCYAVGSWTACVFHLMRVMEAAVRQWAASRKVKATVVTKNRRLKDLMWHEVSDALRQRIDAMPRSTVKQNETRQRNFVVLATLDSVREAWRNPTMHPAAKYDGGEAKTVLHAVQGFLVAVCRVVR